MNCRLLCASLLGLGVVACGALDSNNSNNSNNGPSANGAGAQTPSTTTPDADATCAAKSAPSTCGDAVPIDTVEAVAREINSLTELVEASTAHASGASLLPTRDLRITMPITLEIESVKAPSRAGCASDASDAGLCHETWAFAGEASSSWNFPVMGGLTTRPLPSGVTCADATCTKVTIAPGTTVRFQRAFVPHAFGGSYPHYVRILRSCTDPCADDEIRCSASTTCIAKRSFCSLCVGESNQACACRDQADACVTKPLGSQCSYITSDDTGTAGTCDDDGMCTSR